MTQLTRPRLISLEADRVARQFDKWWPELHDKLERIRDSPAPAVPERKTEEKIDEILTRVRALESVLVTREISDASEELKALQAELRKLRELRDLREAIRVRVAALKARALKLSDAGDHGDEYGNIRDQIAIDEVRLQEVEARIDSVGKYKYRTFSTWVVDRIDVEDTKAGGT